MVVIPL